MPRKPPFVAGLAALSMLACPASALAGGTPLAWDTWNTAVESPSGDARFEAVKAPGDTSHAHSDTVVKRMGPDGTRTAWLAGSFVVPTVVWAQSVVPNSNGLAADGSRLVLIEPRSEFPRRTTSLAVLDAVTLELQQELQLDGDFGFDALSPDGRLLYLKQYRGSGDHASHELRAYDLEQGAFLGGPVFDPARSGSELDGIPWLRAVGPGARWVYTLYESERDGSVFLYALNTVKATAVRIDLNGLPRFSTYNMGMRLVEDDLVVTYRGDAAVHIGLDSLEIESVDVAAIKAKKQTESKGGTPSDGASASDSAPSAGGTRTDSSEVDEDGVPVGALSLTLALAIAVALVLLRRWRIAVATRLENSDEAELENMLDSATGDRSRPAEREHDLVR